MVREVVKVKKRFSYFDHFPYEWINRIRIYVHYLANLASHRPSDWRDWTLQLFCRCTLQDCNTVQSFLSRLPLQRGFSLSGALSYQWLKYIVTSVSVFGRLPPTTTHLHPPSLNLTISELPEVWSEHLRIFFDNRLNISFPLFKIEQPWSLWRKINCSIPNDRLLTNWSSHSIERAGCSICQTRVSFPYRLETMLLPIKR